MNLDLEAMKAAALAATPGEWHAPGLAELHDASNRVIACFSDVDPVAQEERPQPTIDEGDRNAGFAALACPVAVLALIERLERAEALEKQVDTINGFPDIKGDDLPTLRKRFSALYAIAWAKERHLEAVQRDLDALRASANPDALESERQANAMLTEENDRLQRKLEAAQSALRAVHLYSFSPGQPESIALDRLRVFAEEIALGAYAEHELREKALAALGRRL